MGIEDDRNITRPMSSTKIYQPAKPALPSTPNPVTATPPTFAPRKVGLVQPLTPNLTDQLRTQKPLGPASARAIGYGTGPLRQRVQALGFGRRHDPRMLRWLTGALGQPQPRPGIISDSKRMLAT